MRRNKKNRPSAFRKLQGRRLAKGSHSAQTRRTNLSIEPLETRNLLAVAMFQQGAANYAGQEDTVLYSREPDVNFGTEGSISPDQQDANGVRQGLVRFNNIIGSDPGQIPLGAQIISAKLTFNVVNDSNSAMQMSAYRMLTDWSESTSTWNSFGEIGGVQASEGESSDLPPDGILYDADTSELSPTAGLFDVTRSLEYWVSGAENYGWMIESAATNGWDFRTKESAQELRPMLRVEYEVPGTPQFQILNTSLVHAEGNTGTTTAIIEVARAGSISGAASINYTVAAGGTKPAGAGDFVAQTTTALNFAADQSLATIEVTINGDTELEGFETVLVTLSDGNIVADRGVATIQIADDDALINEVLANVTPVPNDPPGTNPNPDDETDREYIELIGTPGATLDGYYFAVLEAEEEGDAGAAIGGTAAGVADLVISLAGLQFGANGLLVLVPGDPNVAGFTWEYASLADPQTTIVEIPALMGAGGVLEDASQTYALFRSPTNPIVQGTDYDQDGVYEDQTNQAIGGTLLNPNFAALGEAPRFGDLLGDLDRLPEGAELVDSVGVVEGGGGDRDRIAAVPFPGDISARPGIHVHQPTPFTPGGNVTSDAVTRRFGQTLPNSIGAWFNGDISDANAASGPIEYLNDSFFISVVAPDGAVITPGAANVLRTVFFDLDDQSKEVAEADGSVTLTINRTGDLSEEIMVTYQTVDVGSATEDEDYEPVEETIVFGNGVASMDIIIDILQDDDAEGFERFRVDITEVSNGSYLIGNGRPTGSGVNNGEAVVTIADANVSIATFQNGDGNGYNGTSDATLDGEFVFDKFGQGSVVRVDQVKGEGEDTPENVRPQQGLIKFDNLFGDGPGQVPIGSTIFDAFLTLNVSNVASGAEINFFRMLQNWEEVNATWANPQGNAGFSIVNGVTPDGIEASSEPDSVVTEPGRAGLVQIPLNADTLQSWNNGSLANFGWSIISDSGSLWRFDSSEATLLDTFRPELTILYTEPEETTGTFSFSMDNYTVNELGGTATLTVNRIGGSTGMATVDWNVAPGTGDLTDIVGASSGSIVFNEGELFKTFDVVINDDTDLESNETLNLTLSGTGLDFDRNEAVLTIRDNDFLSSGASLLLNEIWINSPGNDPPHEFVELVGDPGVGLGSLYYIAIEGLVGDHEGTAEKVVDLGAYTNGTNGFSLLTPDAADFAFRVPDGTTQIDKLGSIGTENVASQNDSTTYMLIYSPFIKLTETTFDYDWTNLGSSLELLSLPGVQIIDSVGVRVLSAEGQDQLYGPSSNLVSFALTDPDVDAISRFRGNSQSNRGLSWYGGDLEPAGDDYLLYEAAEAFRLPLTGTAMTPGEENTGNNDLESPLVSLTSVTPNPNGTVSVVFSGPISQVLAGDGGPASPGGSGITITDTNGAEISNIDTRPAVSGLGSNTLVLSFSGAGVVNGQLPAGTYHLNFVGNGLVANGRAVDVSSDGTEIDASFTHEFSPVAPGLPGDFSNNGAVENADLTLLLNNWAKAVPPIPAGWLGGPITGPTVDNDELTALLNNWGQGNPGSGSGPAAPVNAVDAAVADLSSSNTVTRRPAYAPTSRAAFSSVRAADSLLLVATAQLMNPETDSTAPAVGRPTDGYRPAVRHFDDVFAQLGS